MGYWTVILSANQNSVFPNLFYFMNQIRNCVFFLVFYGASRTPSEVGIIKNCGLFLSEFFFTSVFLFVLCHYKKSPQAKIRRFLNNSSLLRWGLYGKKNALSPFPSSLAPLLLFFTGIPSRSFCRGERNNFSFSAKSSLCIVFDQVLH